MQSHKPGKVNQTSGQEKGIVALNRVVLLSEDIKAWVNQGHNTQGHNMQLKVKKMPPKIFKIKKMNPSFINDMKTQTSGLVTLEYAKGEQKIRLSFQTDHSAVMIFLNNCGMKFFTFNPNPDQRISFF